MKNLLPLFILILAVGANAATITVTRSDDRNAVCNSGVDCSLREAVSAANTTATDDVINFAQGLTTITLSDQIQIENFGALSINGLGAKVFTIDGNSRNNGIQFGNRIFYINGATVTITDVRLTGGNLAGPPQIADGGGIFVNEGTLALDRVHVTGNQTVQSGGGIYYSGGTNHRITNSTVSNNIAFQSGGGFILAGGMLYVANTTISDNQARIGSFNSSGGGFVGSPTLRNVTVTRNGSRNGGPIIGSPDMRNTIVLSSNLPSGGFGLCQISAENNLIGDCDPSLILGPLQDNGGPTPTQALLPNSQAIDAGNNAFAVDPFDNSPLLTDQRGFPRIVDGNGDGIATVDIGAFELAPVGPTAASVSVSGRVLSSKGRGVFNAVVHLTKQNGEIQTARTNPFGYYTFRDIAAGETYIFNVYAKRYQFNPQVITLTEDLDSLNFTAQ